MSILENNTDIYFMRQALQEAYKAYKINEVPVGAVIVKNGEILSRGFNRCISMLDPTAHAEIVALRKAAKKLQNYRLNDCHLYVTIEPCIMCAGSLVNARVKKIIFGSFDKNAGACKSVFEVTSSKKLNHRIEVVGGKKEYLSLECSSILLEFFKKRRKN